MEWKSGKGYASRMTKLLYLDAQNVRTESGLPKRVRVNQK